MAEDRKRLGERLVEAGLLTEAHIDAALELQKTQGGRLGDVLLENGMMSESALLRFLAAEYNTRYVSTEKLSKVKVPSAILDKLPVRMAEQTAVIPILWDEGTQALSVVLSEPQNLQLIEEIRLVSGASVVHAYISSRSAVKAAVRKHYYGDISAFADLDATRRNREDVKGLMDYYEHQHTGVSELRVPTETSPNVVPQRPGEPDSQPTGVRRTIDEVHGASLTSDNDFIETLNVLIGLIEMPRPTFKGHSAAVAKLTRSISRRMGLSERDMNHAIIAAYLHDLGKKPERHLTLPRIAEDDAFREHAAKYFRTPTRLFEAVHLPVEVNAILGQLYEAWDGSGVPEGRREASISLGARIVAAVDAYEDFIRVPAPGADKPMSRDAAIAEVQAYSGTMLDPQIVELLSQILSGDLMRQMLLANGQHIVVVDPDPENSSLLELKLTQKGYVVSIARDGAAATAILARGADLAILESSLPDENGFAFLAGVRRETWGRNLPVVYLTADARSESVERGLSLGAADYVVKPYAVEVFLAKVKRILDTSAAQGAQGKSIRGSLDEMSVVDILRILCEARRSGRIEVRGRRRTGEVFLSEGRVVHVTFDGASGEEGFTGIMSIRTGEFTFSPEVEPVERSFDLAPEDLITRAKQRLAHG